MDHEEKARLTKKFKQLVELAAYISGNLEEPNLRLRGTSDSIIEICEQELRKLKQS